MAADVQQQELPGIGRRYDLMLERGRMSVVTVGLTVLVLARLMPGRLLVKGTAP